MRRARRRDPAAPEIQAGEGAGGRQCRAQSLRPAVPEVVAPQVQRRERRALAHALRQMRCACRRDPAPAEMQGSQGAVVRQCLAKLPQAVFSDGSMCKLELSQGGVAVPQSTHIVLPGGHLFLPHARCLRDRGSCRFVRSSMGLATRGGAFGRPTCAAAAA